LRARYNDKTIVQDHYDTVSPYYQQLWGEHIHHGYWIRGDETKEQAQLQLIEHLASAAAIPRKAKVLDVGCGFGASSIYLAKTFGVQATGITISPVQVEMANEAARRAKADARFLLMDAEAMKFDEFFDVVWSVESVSHYQDVERFFASAAKLLPVGGTVAILDWFKREGLTPREYKKNIVPIERGMMVELHTMHDYERWMTAAGLRIARTENLSKRCAKTWEVGAEIIKDKSFWKLAAVKGIAFVHYLRAFAAMRAGFASGRFEYGMLVARKS